MKETPWIKRARIFRFWQRKFYRFFWDGIYHYGSLSEEDRREIYLARQEMDKQEERIETVIKKAIGKEVFESLQ